MLINMVMISANLATPGLLKIKIFWNKGYDVIVLDYGITNKILSRDADYIVDVVIWPKLSKSGISISYHNLNFIRIRPEKPLFEGWPWFNFNNLELALGITLKFYTIVEKGIKLNFRTFCGISFLNRVSANFIFLFNFTVIFLEKGI